MVHTLEEQVAYRGPQTDSYVLLDSASLIHLAYSYGEGFKDLLKQGNYVLSSGVKQELLQQFHRGKHVDITSYVLQELGEGTIQEDDADIVDLALDLGPSPVVLISENPQIQERLSRYERSHVSVMNGKEYASCVGLVKEEQESSTKRIELSRRIEGRLQDLAQEARKNQDVSFDLERLTQRLGQGNLNAGIGTKHLQSTDVSYLRARNGGRVYFRTLAEDVYEVIAESGKGNNQDKVIEEIYLQSA